MAKYKVPGLFVEEIPPLKRVISLESVAAFIGYTEKHQNEKGESLLNVPTEIRSLPDYEKFFGAAQSEENIQITDRSTPAVQDIKVIFNGKQSQHNLYYSLRHFFANGGRSCKIVSVGTYKMIGELLSADIFIDAIPQLTTEYVNYLIAVPESQNLPEEGFYRLQQKILEFCAAHKSFAVLDLPKADLKNFLTTVSVYREKLQSPFLSFGSAFFPNLVTGFSYAYDETKVSVKKDDQVFSLRSIEIAESELYHTYRKALTEFCMNLPPSAAVSGATLKCDSERGVWKTPASIPLADVKNPEIMVSTAQQQQLNFDPSGKSVNCIKNFPGKGNLIWGGRTLAGNDPEWKYMLVRRLANQVENDISVALQAFVFEVNAASTWVQVKMMIENYLIMLWKTGAFPGNKPAEAFFVKCGLGETMTAQDLLDGKLVVMTGIAITRPSEFIIISFSQTMQP